MPEPQVLKLSVELILGISATLFVSAVAAAWVLLHSLVFVPLREMKDELNATNRGLLALTTEMTEVKNVHATKIEHIAESQRVQWTRIEKVEDQIREIRSRELCR
jgi:hypothetical protein